MARLRDREYVALCLMGRKERIGRITPWISHWCGHDWWINRSEWWWGKRPEASTLIRKFVAHKGRSWIGGDRRPDRARSRKCLLWRLNWRREYE